MPTNQDTVNRIISATDWNQRIAQIRLVPQNHGTSDHTAIYSSVARSLYLPHLSPDFAYIHKSPFYSHEVFQSAYDVAAAGTDGFKNVTDRNIAAILVEHPQSLLVFRTITGLTKGEFAHCTELAAAAVELKPISVSKIDSCEKEGTKLNRKQADLLAFTIGRLIEGKMFAVPPEGTLSKQAKPDTVNGWRSVTGFASEGVSYATFLHQRHYGGAYRQVLDATSTKRGDELENSVEQIFKQNKILFIRTGSHNQSEIANRFEVTVTPAPDFVVYDNTDTLRAILECKATNDGGTARDKAMRFNSLQRESQRLGGIPLVAVLGGIGWARINDALAPVVRDCQGRVFTQATLEDMLQVAPFPELMGQSG